MYDCIFTCSMLAYIYSTPDRTFEVVNCKGNFNSIVSIVSFSYQPCHQPHSL
uniref:Uncharacterized protein n=1 Tax=Rhizophora mucronata TaxID=61149 RepID=A0A2P2QFX4_RHIMU